MKKQHLFYSVAGCVLLVIFLLSGYWLSLHNLSFTCSSSTASFASNINNTVALNFTQSMTFSYRGKAVVHLSGYFTTGDTRHVLNRTIVYAYTRTGTSDYSLRVVNATRAGSDTVPENLERTYLGPILQGAYRIIGIREMPSGDMLIANNAGPYLICAVH
ncbi:hypothetical protein C3432_20990 [Citrobacter amalonaticus]|uniref:Uncharacterized protein n=1 Tax=Citrobacter amalonaticus TaxID=35703 RepID=A0A2S4RV00_CITAM|nr:hypothetical protein [Citrobacter amalonaticus]POT55532.1 hypothetical protein C3432_20990 [Citrobacter amalonaticus]POT73743.1 hypothetical protein C3436_18455 [Citrobacter amalonaticus]POU63968.1 hypothetical protein C3430_17390 [Citrobacter amalonaticus]POV03601.1 hypothetical protein C3424_20305 [Citrobacter amalonaticus]